MSAYEMMLSESQERMLMVLKPEKEKEAEAIFRKWGLDFAVVGYTTPSKRFVVKHGGDVMADLPIKELGDEAPLYDRPHVETPKQPVVKAADVVAPVNTADALAKLLGTPGLVSSAGCGSNTITSFWATPCSAPAAMPQWCASGMDRRGWR